MPRPTGDSRFDVLLVLMGSPYDTDVFQSALRLAVSVCRTDASACIWACGYASTLTSAALGSEKPRDLGDWAVRKPSTAAIVADAVRENAGLTWMVCGACAEDRAALPAHPAVVVAGLSRFSRTVAAARTTMFMGVM